jgi:hypothetical protein
MPGRHLPNINGTYLDSSCKNIFGMFNLTRVAGGVFTPGIANFAANANTCSGTVPPRSPPPAILSATARSWWRTPAGPDSSSTP